MAIRIRWYLCTASLTASGRPTNAVLGLTASGAHCYSLYGPSAAAPAAALVRVIQETAAHDALEAAPTFAVNCLALRVGALWSSLPTGAKQTTFLAQFGLLPTDMDAIVGAAINRIGQTRFAGFLRTLHIIGSLAQYATAED